MSVLVGPAWLSCSKNLAKLVLPKIPHPGYLIKFPHSHPSPGNIWSPGLLQQKSCHMGLARRPFYPWCLLLVSFYPLTPTLLLSYKPPLFLVVFKVEPHLTFLQQNAMAIDPTPILIVLNNVCLSVLASVMNNFFFNTAPDQTSSGGEEITGRLFYVLSLIHIPTEEKRPYSNFCLEKEQTKLSSFLNKKLT